MRRIILSAAVLLLAGFAFGQNFKYYVQSASTDLQNYNIAKAKESVDLALGFEEAGTDAKIWHLVGNVHYHIYNLAHFTDVLKIGDNQENIVRIMGAEPARVKRNKKVENGETWYYYYLGQTGIKSVMFMLEFENNILVSVVEPEEVDYRGLAEDPLKTAHDAYMKSIKINPNFYNPLTAPMTPAEGMILVAGLHYNEGVNAYNNKDYAKAGSAFEQTSLLTERFSPNIDTAATENAAISYKYAEDYPKALEMYQKLVSIGYKKAHIYLNLADLAKITGDTAAAFGYINEGRAIYPEDFDLLITETNLFLNTGQVERATDNLMKAKEKQPDNANLFYVIGTQYFDRLKGQDYDKDTAAYNYSFRTSEEYLLEAIRLDDSYFDAMYNLGALYVNEGVRVFEIADQIDPLKNRTEYLAHKEVYEAHWANAVIYMEKARVINPKDLDTLRALKQLYARNNEFDKTKELDVIIDAITGKE